MILSTKTYFKREQELLNISDDDDGEYYIARVTRSQKHDQQGLGTAKDLVLDGVQSSSTSSSFKRKSTALNRSHSSPRIKRPKSVDHSPITAQQVEAAAQGPIFEPAVTDVKNKSPSSTPLDIVTHQPAGSEVGARVDFGDTPIIIDDKHSLSARTNSMTGALPLFSSGKFPGASAASASSSPIEDPSFSSVFVAAAPRKKPAGNGTTEKETKKGKGKGLESEESAIDKFKALVKYHTEQEIEVQSKHAAARDKTKAKVKKQKPLPPQLNLRVEPPDESSIIDNFTDSVATSPDARTSSPIPTGFRKSSKTGAKLTSIGASKAIAKVPPTKARKGKQSVRDWIIAEQEAYDSGEKKPSSRRAQFLVGFRIFLCDLPATVIGDRMKARIDIVLRHGGRLVPDFDPLQITHIVVVDKDVTRNQFLRTVKLKSLDEIPDEIPILRWTWMAALMTLNEISKGGKTGPIHLIPDEKLFEYGHFSQRLPKVPRRNDSRRVQKRTTSSSSADASHISNDEDEDGAPTTRHRPSVETKKSFISSRVPLDLKVENDPLVACYLQERARDQEFPTYSNEFDTDTDNEDRGTNNKKAEAPTTKRNGGWLCKDPTMRAAPCPNEDIIQKLEELKALHMAKPTEDDKWRVYSLNKSIRAIRNYPRRLKSVADAQKLRGVGKKTAEKIMEIANTGDLQRIKYERTEDVLVTSIFTKIYGVGQTTAQKWYNNGCRTLDDLRNGIGGVSLSEGQKIGIEFYDDLNTRMPREEANAIFELIKPIALRIDPNLFVEIMGSYRRGKADCGDIDILITRDPSDGRTHEGVLRQLLDKLHKAGILTEDLALPDYTKPLEAVYHGICRLPKVEGARRRRIDFLTVPWSSMGGALLYYTGDDMFNRSMRLLANKMHYSLNQRGLYAGVVRDPRNRTVKLNTGNLIASATEKEIFEALNVPWREPHERVTYYEDIVKAQETKKKLAERS